MTGFMDAAATGEEPVSIRKRGLNMKERVTEGQSPIDQRRKQEEEILDIADLLEDVPDLQATDEAAYDGELELANFAATEFQADQDSVDLDQIFNELDEEEADDDEEIIDLVDLADEDEEKEASGGAAYRETIEAGQDDLDDFSFEDLELEGPSAEGEKTEVDLDEDFISAFELEELLGDSPEPQDSIGSNEDQTEKRNTEDIEFADAFDTDLLRDSDELALLGEEKPAIAAVPAIAGRVFASVEEKDPVAADDAEALGIGEAQIDAAVERVIRKIYAEKIDSILVDAIEKTVQKEIDRLKALIHQGPSDQ